MPDIKHSDVEPRFMTMGQTDAGRFAFVIFTPRLRGGRVLARPVSARFMHDKEIRKYEQEIARLQKR
jgi:hypothetical protein